MKKVLIIGSGISGLSCAIRCAKHGMQAILVSPFPSERSQSVMAAGGINAVTNECEQGDSVESHIEDTLKGGCYIAGEEAVKGLCRSSNEIQKYLESIGAVFSVDENGRPMRRAFGGQSHRRTYYCGSGTGKLIVSALVMEARRYEAENLIIRRFDTYFYSALISDGVCRGALFFDEKTKDLEPIFADAVVMATGGQNAVFGKTTGSTVCDGYAAGKLFMQGVDLKNLEFIQYHPTTLETSNKRMLISEAVRGEGGRLFYLEDNKHIYFLEDKYGKNGNLMTRDVISREIAAIKKQVYLDISFLDKKIIDKKLGEVSTLCQKYRGIDISKEPIPVAPSVHFFMGGIAVHLNHETNIKNLYAIGECASIYHGANRLGGNSLLAAIYGGNVSADDITGRESKNDTGNAQDFAIYIEQERKSLKNMLDTQSPFPSVYIRDELAATMNGHLGIVRDENNLKEGIEKVDYLISVADKIKYDSSVSPYTNYSLGAILALSRAALGCAFERKESRGAHFRSDHQESCKDMQYASIVSYVNGSCKVKLDKEKLYES